MLCHHNHICAHTLYTHNKKQNTSRFETYTYFAQPDQNFNNNNFSHVRRVSLVRVVTYLGLAVVKPLSAS